MNTKINGRRARALTFMLSLGMLAGVLIWAKLRLVTDIPRSALAVPEAVEGDAGGVGTGGDVGGDEGQRSQVPEAFDELADEVAPNDLDIED